MAKHRKNKKRKMLVVRIGELATPERRKKLGGVVTEVVDRDAAGKAYIRRQRVRIECMLDYYFDAFHINNAQLTAGLKFREIYLRVNYDCNGKVLCNPFLMEAGQADPEGKAHAHLHCIRMLDEAYAQLTVTQRDIVRNVCGHDEYAGNHARKKTLLRALDILAVHWGYAKPVEK